MGIVTREGTYLEFAGPQDDELVVGSLENKQLRVRLLNVRQVGDSTHATVYVPLMPFCSDAIPSCLGGEGESGKALFCSNSLKWKEAGTDVSAAVRKTEQMIDSRFSSLFVRWTSGKVSDYHFIVGYRSLMQRIRKEYERNFVALLPKNA